MKKKLSPKSVNISIEKENKPKYVSEDYIDFRTGKVHPFSESALRELVEKLIDNCSDNHAITAVEDFYLPLRIDPKTWFRWVHKYEWFSRANDMAIRILGRKRYNKIINWEYDRVPISHTQHRYESEWLESSQYHSDLKKQESAALPAQVQPFKVPEFPDSGMVSDKT